jgi:hypothetical protein
MRLGHVKHHILRDYRPKARATDAAEVATADEEDRFHNAVAFTCLLAHPDGRLYCGITCADGDILYRFDPEGGEFESLHYGEIAERFEVKVHRSLELASDGTIYGASACLFRADQRMEAPGGSLFRVAPDADRAEKFARPVAHDYIQTITLDEERGLIYGQTYPCFRFFVYNLRSCETKDFGYIGSITHVSALDDDGGFWGTWDSAQHWLFRYDPDQDEITWFRHGLPGARADSNIMYPGAGPVDCMINGGDGYLYVGTCGGSLCRLDPATAEVTYLGKPSASRRLPGLVPWADGLLLGCAGDEAGSNVFAYDRESNAFHRLGPIVDSETGLTLYRVHDLRLTAERTAFVAETDVPDRSGYLWQCELEL